MAGFVPSSGRLNPRPPIVHPTGTNTFDFSHKERMGRLTKNFALGLLLWLEREDKVPVHNEIVQDARVSLKDIRRRLWKSINKNANLFIVNNQDSVHVIQWALMGRNSGGHNNLPRLNSQEHYYLSSIVILMGPDMINYPIAHSEAIAALNECALVPLTIAQLLLNQPV